MHPSAHTNTLTTGRGAVADLDRRRRRQRRILLEDELLGLLQPARVVRRLGSRRRRGSRSLFELFLLSGKGLLLLLERGARDCDTFVKSKHSNEEGVLLA